VQHLLRSRLVAQLLLFATVGVVFTGAYVLLYVLLYGRLGSFWANLVALVVSTVTETAAQRRVTFGVRGRRAVVRHEAQGLLLLAVGLGVTSGALWLLHAADPGAGRLVEVAVLGVANLLVGLGRFIAFRFWVFARRPSDSSAVSPDGQATPRDGQSEPVICTSRP
jgi:putative flippase GtrA